jgi:hypothetical protein
MHYLFYIKKKIENIFAFLEEMKYIVEKTKQFVIEREQIIRAIMRETKHIVREDVEDTEQIIEEITERSPKVIIHI